MGANMVRRLMRDGHEVVVWNRSPQKAEELAGEGAEPAPTIPALVEKLAAPRVVWLMVPSAAVDDMISQVAALLQPGDLLIDGANSNFHNSVRRGQALAEKGILFMDAGTSGGVWGLQNGYCMMVGGTVEAFGIAEPLLKSLAPPNGYLHCGAVGAGHFVKMIHNGIEYGMLQAYGEGFEIMKHADFDLDLHGIARLWNQGSVVRSWLLELAEGALEKDPDLKHVRGWVEDSGEGRWTVLEAIDKSVPAPVITLSLLARFASRQDESYSAQFVAALRNQFGGHDVKV